MKRLKSVLAFLPLALAMWLTFQAQALWRMDVFLDGAPIYLLWLILIVGWLFRGFDDYHRRQKRTRKTLVLPACLAFVGVCVWTDAPFRFLFWTHKSALEQALKRPAANLDEAPQTEPIGSFAPVEIAKSGKATRLLLWKNSAGLYFSTEAVGFAHCPGDKGCAHANFDDNRSPSAPLRDLGDDWYVVSRFIPD